MTVLILAGSVVWTMVTLAAIDRPSQTPTLSIEITGQQWWWKVRYLSDKPSEIFNTANEIHIPAGVPVKVMLRSRDVIHSFWVPALQRQDRPHSRTSQHDLDRGAQTGNRTSANAPNTAACSTPIWRCVSSPKLRTSSKPGGRRN